MAGSKVSAWIYIRGIEKYLEERRKKVYREGDEDATILQHDTAA